MNRTIELRIGGLYFHARFLDEDLTIPIIGTYVYLGFDETNGHEFQDVGSCLAHSDGLPSAEGHVLHFPKDSIEGMFDDRFLIEWLAEEHSPESVGPTYVYKAT